MAKNNAIAHTITEQPDSDDYSMGTAWYFNTFPDARRESSRLVPDWGDPSRGFYLRRLFYNWANLLVVGAINNLIQRIKQTPWEISGTDDKLTTHYQKLLQHAGLGKGFDAFMSGLLQDFFTLDTGAYVEIIAPGSPSTPVTSRVTGINVLDGLRCYPTGNYEYPVFYRPHKSNKLIKLHRTRVVRLTDLPSPDPQHKGMGLSAMSRALAVVEQQQLLIKYNVSRLDELPATGIITFSGVSNTTMKDAIRRYKRENAENDAVLHRLIQLTSIDPSVSADVNYIPFSEMPEGANQTEKMQLHVNLLALAIGDDPQEIWPLASQAMGSGNQSLILHRKAKGKTYGNALTLLERMINIYVLPKGLELKFKPSDTEQDKREAETAQIWANAATTAVSSGIINQALARRLLANTSPAFNDALMDENGHLRLPDDDVIVPDNNNAPAAESPVNVQPVETTDEEDADKQVTTLKVAFANNFADLLEGARDDDFNRRRFGLVLRALIARYGRLAYQAGLFDSAGVLPQDISEKEQAEINTLVQEQSGYVTEIGRVLYHEGGITKAQATRKPDMWWKKSVEPFYYAGLRAGDRNAYYGWRLGATEQHCKDCLRFSLAHVHRISDWLKSGWEPGSSSLECNGFECDCSFYKTNGPAKGRF